MAGTIRDWASANDPAYLFMVLPEEIPNLTKGLPQYQAYGDALVRALDDVIVAGQFPAYGGGASNTAPVVTITTGASGSVVVGSTLDLDATATDAEDGPLAIASWTSSNPSIATVSSAGVVTPVAPGTATITATSVADSGGLTGSDTFALTVTAPLPSPPPAGAWFAVDGVVYLVLGEGVEVLPLEAATGGTVRTISGRVRSTASGVRRAWRVPLYALSIADHATLRASIRRRRRVTAGGLVFGAARATGFAATVELTEAEYVHDGTSFTRRPSLILRTVDGA